MTFPLLVAVVKDQGPLGGNLTVCWATEMEGSHVASLNLGWQRRWTPSCIADSPLSTHLGTLVKYNLFPKLCPMPHIPRALFTHTTKNFGLTK